MIQMFQQSSFGIMPVLKLCFKTQRAPALRLALQAALVVTPILIGAAPSQASISVPFSGFEGAFAPVNWTASDNGGGTSTVNSTTMTLTAFAGAAGKGERSLDLNAVLNPIKPEGAIAFTGGSYSFNWTWTFTDSALGVTLPFGPVLGPGQVNNLAVATSGSNLNSPSSYQTSGTYSGTVAAGDTFAFATVSTGVVPGFDTGTSIGVISDFRFLAEYSEVPGPLPLAGAAAGFAWSRRLRRRLKSAQLID
jgi:hypothetical protein